MLFRFSFFSLDSASCLLSVLFVLLFASSIPPKAPQLIFFFFLIYLGLGNQIHKYVGIVCLKSFNNMTFYKREDSILNKMILPIIN